VRSECRSKLKNNTSLIEILDPGRVNGQQSKN